MGLRTETIESKVYRCEKHKDILCRLTYEVTPFREGVFHWFLIRIDELE